MIAYLRKIITFKWTSRSIIGIVLFTHCHVIANISIVNEYFTFAGLEQKRVDDLMRKPSTECIWNLLSSDSTRQGSFPVVKEFCQFLLLLMNKAEQGSTLLYQVPVHITYKVDHNTTGLAADKSPQFFPTEVDLLDISPWQTTDWSCPKVLSLKRLVVGSWFLLWGSVQLSTVY